MIRSLDVPVALSAPILYKLHLSDVACGKIKWIKPRNNLRMITTVMGHEQQSPSSVSSIHNCCCKRHREFCAGNGDVDHLSSSLAHAHCGPPFYKIRARCVQQNILPGTTAGLQTIETLAHSTCTRSLFNFCPDIASDLRSLSSHLPLCLVLDVVPRSPVPYILSQCCAHFHSTVVGGSGQC